MKRPRAEVWPRLRDWRRRRHARGGIGIDGMGGDIENSHLHNRRDRYRVLRDAEHFDREGKMTREEIGALLMGIGIGIIVGPIIYAVFNLGSGKSRE